MRKAAPHQSSTYKPRVRRDIRERVPQVSSEKLVLQYLSLVKAIAWQIYGTLPRHAFVELNDIMQAGHLGLVNASRSYRTDLDVPFASYARHRIRGEILDSLRKLDTASRNLRGWQRRIEGGAHELSLTLGREPTDEEIGALLGVDVARVRKKRLALWHSASCSVPQSTSSEKEKPSVAAVLAKDGMPDDMQERRQLGVFLQRAVSSLPVRSKKVILDYYLHEITMKEIGQMLQVNESRVSQIHKNALQLMARGLRASGIRSASDI